MTWAINAELGTCNIILYAGPWHALTLRSKGQGHGVMNMLPAGVCMLIIQENNMLREHKPPPIRRIRISDFGLPDLKRDPDRHQNCITWSLSHALPLHKISSKSVHKFASNLTDRQTDRQTDRTKNITSFFGGGNNCLGSSCCLRNSGLCIRSATRHYRHWSLAELLYCNHAECKLYFYWFWYQLKCIVMHKTRSPLVDAWPHWLMCINSYRHVLGFCHQFVRIIEVN